MKNIGFGLLCLGLFLFGCTKPSDLSPIPEISFGSMEGADGARQAQDTIYVVINFKDGDGDLGLELNEKDLFLIDTRPGQGDTIPKAMPEVPPLGAENGITGEIRFPLVPCCIPPVNEEGIQIFPICTPIPDEYPDFQRDTLIYEVFIRDRAGNLSNTIQLDPIFLLCD